MFRTCAARPAPCTRRAEARAATRAGSRARRRRRSARRRPSGPRRRCRRPARTTGSSRSPGSAVRSRSRSFDSSSSSRPSSGSFATLPARRTAKLPDACAGEPVRTPAGAAHVISSAQTTHARSRPMLTSCLRKSPEKAVVGQYSRSVANPPMDAVGGEMPLRSFRSRLQLETPEVHRDDNQHRSYAPPLCARGGD